MRRLGVNIDHVATVRQARQVRYPDPVAAAIVAELAGADQITCHIRGDRRHIQDADLPRLRSACQTTLNVEMAPTDEMLSIARGLLGTSTPGPRTRVTLVPEREGEVTTEGGLDVVSHRDLIAAATRSLVDAGIRVSLFIDPEPDQIRASAIPGVDMIELNTARYAEEGQGELERLTRAANLAEALELELAAGHGLTHHNLAELVAAAPNIVEYNIGHSIVARALFVGFDSAVRDLLAIIRV